MISDKTIRRLQIAVLLLVALLLGYLLIPSDVIDVITQYNAIKQLTKTHRNHGSEDEAVEPPPAATSRAASKADNPRNAAAAVAIDSEEQFASIVAKAKELGVSTRWNPAIRRMMLHGRDDIVRNLLAEKQFAELEVEYNIFVSLIPEKTTEHIIGPTGRPFYDTALKWIGIADGDKPSGQGVKIVMLDTAVDLSIPALAKASIISDDLFGLGSAPGSHGTMVASLLAGSYDDSVHGAANAADIVSIPVMDADGNGYVFTLADGIVAAADSGAQIISMSVSCPYESAVLRAAVDYALSKGCVIVAAAGNEGVAADGTSTVGYPAAYEGVIAVGAVNADGGRAGFSSTGEEVTVVAPGVGIFAQDSDGVALFGGTSASAPLAAGAIACVMGEKGNVTAVEAAKMLLEHTNDAGMPGVDNEYGLGQLNVERVLKSDEKDYSDFAAADVFLKQNDDGSRSLYFTAQNRGNETIDEMTLLCTINYTDEEPTTEIIKFNDINPEQSVSVKIDVPDGKSLIIGDLVVTSPSDDGNSRNNGLHRQIWISDTTENSDGK